MASCWPLDWPKSSVSAITDIITRHVSDKKILSDVVVELQLLMTRDNGPMYAAVDGGAADHS
jgi:hypothetical protein